MKNLLSKKSSLKLSLTAFVFASTVGAIIALPTFAQARRDQLREGHQQTRIHEGRKSGELTRGEAHRLNRGQQRIDQAQRRVAQDGSVSENEQAKLERMQDVQSARIYRQKHDAQKRPEPSN